MGHVVLTWKSSIIFFCWEHCRPNSPKRKNTRFGWIFSDAYRCL